MYTVENTINTKFVETPHILNLKLLGHFAGTGAKLFLHGFQGNGLPAEVDSLSGMDI